MKKILLCYTELLHYRVEVFQLLGTVYDLTVVHSGKPLVNGRASFREVVLPAYKLGRLRYQPGLIRMIHSGGYDSVIFFADLAWVSTSLGFIFCPRDTRRVTWGLWRTGNRFYDAIRIRMALTADSNIFYSSDAAKDFVGQGLPLSKAKIARNTIYVESPGREEKSARDSVLVVGSFNARKQNDLTLRAFALAADRLSEPYRLVFVGGGPDLKRITELARSLEISDRIEFHRATSDPRILKDFYSRAICSVSFGQAGLSVLQSFGHGVPYVTKKDAVSGGEIENIQSGVNGALCEPNQRSLEAVLVDLLSNPCLAAEMGKNAADYYKSQASTQVMVDGFVSAIFDPTF